MTTTQHFTGTLVVEHCCECGVAFGMEREFNRNRHEDRKLFFCPNGHSQHYAQSTEQKLRNEIVSLNARIDQKDAAIRTEREQRYATERSLKATKGVVTRIKRRAAKGVCPCCNRTFSQLERHMATKHPEFVAENAPTLPVAEIHKRISKR